MKNERVILRQCGMNFSSYEKYGNEENNSAINLYLSFKLDDKPDSDNPSNSLFYNSLKSLFTKTGYTATNIMKDILSLKIADSNLDLNIKHVDFNLPNDLQDFFLEADIHVIFESDFNGLLFYNTFSDKQKLSDFIIVSFNNKISEMNNELSIFNDSLNNDITDYYSQYLVDTSKTSFYNILQTWITSYDNFNLFYILKELKNILESLKNENNNFNFTINIEPLDTETTTVLKNTNIIFNLNNIDDKEFIYNTLKSKFNFNLFDMPIVFVFD